MGAVVPERAQRRLIVPLDEIGGGGHAVQPQGDVFCAAAPAPDAARGKREKSIPASATKAIRHSPQAYNTASTGSW